MRFDRLNPEPPKYLTVLRNRGHWRFWNNNTGKRFVPSDALRRGSDLTTEYRTFLDAGCGQSPDAAMAIKHLGFKSAIKVDLWPPYEDEYFAKELRKFEGRKVEFVQGDVCKLTDLVPIESVDLIGCNAMIDLVCADDRLLFYNEAWGVLAPYGVLSVYHIALAHGHQDWISGTEEVNRISACGYADFECLVATKSALVLRRNP